jgi:hypothetical protein
MLRLLFGLVENVLQGFLVRFAKALLDKLESLVVDGYQAFASYPLDCLG